MVYLSLFILGLCVGSFLNVIVYRLNLTSQESRSLPRHLRGVLGGRSFCPKCKHQLAWFDNLPLLSFILLKGRCRYCGKRISWQYPLVELAAGVLTVLVFRISYLAVDNNLLLLFPPLRESAFAHSRSVFSLLVTGYLLLVTYSLIVIFVSDWLYEIIPDEVSYPTMVMAVVYQLALSFLSPLRGMAFANPRSVLGIANLGGFLLAGLGAVGFFLLLNLVTRGKGMGMGDVKLAGLMGLVLGYPKIVVALMLAFLTGAIVGVILILLGRKRFGEHLPFGPFLAAATWVSLFWGEEMIAFYCNYSLSLT